jgi:hypothetical protein
MAVIMNQCANLVFCFLHQCYGWSATAGPVINVLFLTLEMTDPVSNSANIYGILTICASLTSMNLYWTGALCRKKFNHHSLHGKYVHNIRIFALLLC